MKSIHLVRTVVLILVLAFTLGLTGVNYGRHTAVLDEFEDQDKEEKMQKLTSTWTDTDGLGQEVCTPRLDDEPVQDWVNRHKEAVDAMKVAFPPQPLVE